MDWKLAEIVTNCYWWRLSLIFLLALLPSALNNSLLHQHQVGETLKCHLVVFFSFEHFCFKTHSVAQFFAVNVIKPHLQQNMHAPNILCFALLFITKQGKEYCNACLKSALSQQHEVNIMNKVTLNRHKSVCISMKAFGVSLKRVTSWATSGA